MKQNLQARMQQHLALTPQLQQAIRLLQLSSQELRHEIEQVIEANPLLELNEDPLVDPVTTSPEANQSEPTVSEDTFVDYTWDSFVKGPKTNYDGGSISDLERIADNTESLADHLTWQMRLAHFSEVDMEIAQAIIDSIDEKGFLTTSLDDIHISLSANSEIELDEVTAVLHRIQSFEPTGVGARDLAECLSLQLKQLPTDTPHLQSAQLIVREHLALLGQHDNRQLKKVTKFNDATLHGSIALIQSLNPKPGNAITNSKINYIVPEVIVKKVDGHWQARLNVNSLPRVNLHQQYAQVLAHDKQHALHTQLQEARWFLKSLASRNDTLLKVAQCIVEHQQDFFEHGDVDMQPLTLKMVADEIGMHESTISRVTTHKYMYTPQGVYELKHFFSSHVDTDAGDASSTAVRAMIKKFIAEESHKKPLSDNKITHLLSDQGVHIARRTVTKYREALGIPASHLRKDFV
jgi:RNA polymerase sigma-54 factor